MSEPSDPAADHHDCTGWAEIAKHLEAFPSPAIGFDAEGEVTSFAWAFRGLRDAAYPLEPAIERAAALRDTPWAALELLVSTEFRSRAHMHLGAASIPKDDLTWLALMQHYAIPTRLLDFTYSPFVALYFAIRHNQGDAIASKVRLWAINVRAVNDRFQEVAWKARSEAYAKEQKRRGITPEPAYLNIGDLDSYATSRDSMAYETQGLAITIAEALAATGTRRRVQEQQGCVCAASPPAFNPRLASQQGVFLLNCAEDVSFRESLTRMMHPRENWCRTFDIAALAIPEIEERLYQLNIHEQSLFPDMEGLAGLIRQKIRLHWK
jgi:hypothetical protein